MPTSDADRAFAGSIPKLYDQLLVPLIFEPYAIDLGRRAAALAPARVLELAAGTGVVTRELARVLDPTVELMATDLNQAMLDKAAAVGTARPVSWRQADAMKLPFADASFDLVLCQFGAMFFPDKGAAFAEARRVLRPGGRFIFNVWDRLEANEFADVVTRALAQCFPLVPPRFMARVPHGYHQQSTIGRDLARGGFAGPPGFETLPQRSRADSALLAATAYCQGTLLRNEIEAQGGSRLAEATEIVAAAIAARFGSGAVEGAIQAHVVTVQRES